MAYQNSYGPRPHMYSAGGVNANANANAPHFPPQHHTLTHQQQQQQQQQFYPNPNSNPYPVPQSAGPSAPYIQPQGSLLPANHPSRSHYLPNQSHGNGGPLLMPPPPTVPDDPFKKPYLPQQRTSEPHQHYIQNAQSPPFNPRYTQQQSTSSAPATSNISNTTSREAIQPSNTSLPYPPVSSMTAPATSSTTVTSPPESPSQAQDPSSQSSKISLLDQERVDALLHVNNLLLQEVQILQKAGLKVAQSPQQANPANASSPQAKNEGATPTATDAAEAASQNPATPSSVTTPTTTTPTTLVPPQAPNNPTQNSRKFVEYMGRLKANIYYLVAISNQDKTKQTPKPPYPTLLELPPAWLAEGHNDDDYKRFEALKEGYAKLRELWPDWRPTPRPTPQQMQAQQQQAQQQHIQQQQMQQQQIHPPQAQQQQAQQQAQQQQVQ